MSISNSAPVYNSIELIAGIFQWGLVEQLLTFALLLPGFGQG